MNSLSVHIHSKHYPNGQCAIQALDFQAAAGEFIAIVGPSGAGKTTLLKLVSGLDQEFQGSVRTAPENRISMMFQEPRLMPWLTVEGNLKLVAPSLSPAALREMLDRVGLGQMGALFPRQLSGGMQRRVAMARAFVTQPRLLLMDEPFQSLDAPTAEQLRMQLHALWQRSAATVLFVTHSLAEAVSLANRILFLSAGPSRVVLDLPLGSGLQGGVDNVAVHDKCRDILRLHPELLRGHATTSQDLY